LFIRRNQSHRSLLRQYFPDTSRLIRPERRGLELLCSKIHPILCPLILDKEFVSKPFLKDRIQFGYNVLKEGRVMAYIARNDDMSVFGRIHGDFKAFVLVKEPNVMFVDDA